MHKYLFSLLIIFCFARVSAQAVDSAWMVQYYDKAEHHIKMRDGAELFTIIYTPKDKSKTYPILLNRTPYNASNYGHFSTHGHPSSYLVRDMYILAFQDVRGRYMS